MAKYNLWYMAGLDVFLQSLQSKKAKQVLNEIKPAPYVSPLQSWGVTTDFFTPKAVANAAEIDRSTLEFMQSQFQWKTDISAILENPYDALIVTTATEKIVWANSGFKKMTGFEARFAIGKSPSFLQGPKTSIETKARIKQQLREGIPFTEKLLNYRKSNETYWCQIHIIPMFNAKGISHFLALETDLS